MEDERSQKYDKYVIYLKHDTAHILKCIAEFSNLAFPTLFFKVQSNMFSMRAHNKNAKEPATRMCKLEMPRMQFDEYHIPEQLEEDEEAEFLLPIESNNLKKMLSGILKKDFIQIYILKEDISMIYFSIGNTERNNRKRIGIKLLDLDKLDSNLVKPVELCYYNKNRPTAQALSTEFQEACKQGSVSKIDEIEIQCYKSRIYMISKDAETNGDYSFGNEDDTEILYTGTFGVKSNISAVQKCCPISKKVRLYFYPGKPLLISFCAGDYGYFDIYLVPN